MAAFQFRHIGRDPRAQPLGFRLAVDDVCRHRMNSPTPCPVMLVLLPTDAAAGATCQFEAVTKTLSIGGIYDKYFIPDL